MPKWTWVKVLDCLLSIILIDPIEGMKWGDHIANDDRLVFMSIEEDSLFWEQLQTARRWAVEEWNK